MDIAVQFKKATKHCPCKIKNHPSLMGGFLYPAIFLNCPAFIKVMKIGTILNEVIGGTIVIAAIGGMIYTGVALATVKIQDTFLHDLGGAVQVRGIELYYKGIEPYDPWLPWPWQDKNGHAKVELRGNERVFLRYDDLTAPTLNGRIMTTDSKGEEAEFDGKGKYDGNTLKEIDELKVAFKKVGPDGRSLREIVEAEIQEAITKR